MISRGIAGTRAIHAGTKKLSNTEEVAKKRRSDTQKEITHDRLSLLAAIRPEIIEQIKKIVTKAPQTDLICERMSTVRPCQDITSFSEVPARQPAQVP